MRKLMLVTGLAAGALVASATPAFASHVHSKQVGNGSCVLLAANGGEKDVQLPFATGPENRLHPLHVLVHLGEPGQNFAIGVAGTASDPCGATPDYLND